MSDHTPQDAGMEGLYQKYTVTRNDGKQGDGRRYFVLSPDTDPAALRALSAYAHAVRESDPTLYAELYEAYPELMALRRECESLRAERARHAAVVAAARVYLAPDTGAIPACTAKTPYGKLLQAMREFDGEGGDDGKKASNE